MKKVLNFSFYMMFTLYLLLLLDAVIFNRMGVSMRSVNLIPFQEIIAFALSGNRGAARLNIIGNVLMFIPMGIYLKSIFPKDSFLKGILQLTLMSLSIEVTQFILAAGATDIDDIILNISGGIIGILIGNILFKFLKHPEKMRLVVTILSLLIGMPVVLLRLTLFVHNW